MRSQEIPIWIGIVLVLMLELGCGTSPSTQGNLSPPTQQKEATLYTAKQCFSSMVGLAQRWQPDALPFHMESELTTEATGQGGKASVWRAMFASESRGLMKSFVCSGSVVPFAPPRGYTSGAESAFPPNVPALIFDPAYLQSDSDKAFASSLEHGGNLLLNQDAKQPVTYLLDWDAKQETLLWTVIYGKSQGDRKGLCVINAATGAFIRAGK